MRRGFFRLWVVTAVLWAGMWIVFGINSGLIVTPAHEEAAFVNRESLGLPTDARETQFKMAIANAASRGALPKGQQGPASFNPGGTLAILGVAAGAPAFFLVLGWALVGFGRGRPRSYINPDSGLAP